MDGTRRDPAAGPDTGRGETEFVTRSEEETALLGRLLGELAAPGDVLALSGPLGAGKTALVHGIARGLGIIEPIPSPTFNILLVHAADIPLYHFDLFRLDAPGQLEDIDFFATLEADGVSAIEWADRFPGELPDDRLDVSIEPSGEDERRLTLSAHGSRSRRLARALEEAWGHVESEGGGSR